MCVDLIKAKIGKEAKPFTLRLEQTTREVRGRPEIKQDKCSRKTITYLH